MTTADHQLPLTIAGRSLVDGTRIRWGGFGAVGLGTGLLFTGEAAGIFFGIILLLLGLATWILSSFGSTWWYDIPTPQRYVVAVGSVVGMMAFTGFILCLMLISWMLTMFANS
jgi:hypothetical protein